MEDQMIYNIALTKLPGVGAKRARTLLSYCGSAQAVFDTPSIVADVPGFGQTYAKGMKDNDSLLELAQKELTDLERKGIQAVFLSDPDYPRRLRHIPDSPIVLYKKGNANLNPERTIAIVGTRNATDYGRLITEQIIDGLAAYDVTIISGLAYGIDVTAHRRSVEKGLPTIGVMGTGFGQIYPSYHRSVAHQMLEKGGLLTEFSYEKGPEREHFPMRNRIIAGMSDAVLVVESAAKGGSMITAELALGYDRDVFAVPGRVTDPFAAGCNQLIRHHKAFMVRNSEDIVRNMNWDIQKKARQATLFASLEGKEKDVVELMKGREASYTDELAIAAKMTSGEMASYLLILELKGMVKSVPGNKYLLT